MEIIETITILLIVLTTFIQGALINRVDKRVDKLVTRIKELEDKRD